MANEELNKRVYVREIKEQHDALLLYPKQLDMALGSRMNAALKGRVMISAGGKPYYAVKIDRTGGKDALDTLREALEATTGEDDEQWQKN